MGRTRLQPPFSGPEAPLLTGFLVSMASGFLNPFSCFSAARLACSLCTDSKFRAAFQSRKGMRVVSGNLQGEKRPPGSRERVSPPGWGWTMGKAAGRLELMAALGLEEEGLGDGEGLECPPSPCVGHKWVHLG